VRRFLAARTSLFTSRVQEGRIRDCHGDLRLEHVYILDADDTSFQGQTRLAILDRIEFNDRFRYGDVASEVAFLVMELDSAGRSDLARGFVDAYIAATGDEALRELLPFYLCYRACVRGKVLSFQLDEPEIPAAQREVARQQATELFSLAAHYAHSPAKPTLIMIGGLMGTGKSTIARTLIAVSSDGSRNEEKATSFPKAPDGGDSSRIMLNRSRDFALGWTLISSDVIRKCLAQIDPAWPQPDAFGQGIYRPGWTTRTYDALRTEASAVLAQGRSVLLDASFIRRADRQAMAREASARGADVLFVECVCPPEVALARLAQRWTMRQSDPQYLSSNVASLASDGRPELYAAQQARWEPFVADEECGVRYVVVRTTEPVERCCEQVCGALVGVWS